MNYNQLLPLFIDVQIVPNMLRENLFMLSLISFSSVHIILWLFSSFPALGAIQVHLSLTWHKLRKGLFFKDP